MNTRSYRTARTLANLEAQFDADAQRLAETRAATAERMAATETPAERAARGIAPIEPAQLAAEFAECPHRAWAALARLTERQRIIEAIDYACWLREQGIEKAWGDIRACWERKLAARAAEAESLLALAEAGAFDADGSFEDEGREPEAQPAPVVEVESSKGDGTTYQVAADGSHCTCPGFFYRGTCRHTRKIVEAGWGRAA